MSYFANLRNSLNKPGQYGYAPNIEVGDSIPRVVHQTYFSKHLPPEIEDNIRQLKLINPDWEFKLYDDTDIESYISLYFPSLVKFYQKINTVYGAARADFFRYLLIYNEGGIYLDIKSGAIKPFNQIIKNNDVYLLSNWMNDLGQPYENTGLDSSIDHAYGEFQQWHIVAVKGHPFLKAVINNVCRNIDVYNPFFNHTGRWGVLRVTGPIAYTLAILPLLHQHPHRLERSNEDYGFIYSIFSNNQIPKHHAAFKKHYSAIDESIVKLAWLTNLVFKITQPVKEKLIGILKTAS